MEACMMKPEVKKKPKSPKPPPKPTEIKRNEPQRPEKPPPAVPQRPTDSELSHTQYRLKKVTAAYNGNDGNVKQRQTKDKPPEMPVVPPRPTEKELNAPTRYSQRRPSAQTKVTESAKETEQLEAAAVPKDDADFKQGYMTNGEEKTDDVPVKQAPDSKPASRKQSPDSSAEEVASENQQSVEKIKQEKTAESKQVSKAVSDAEEEAKTSETSHENLSSHSDLSASSDSLSENKEKNQWYSGMLKKRWKPTESLQTDQDNKADSNSEDLEEEEKTSEMSHEKGSYLFGFLKKPKKTAAETPTQENLIAHCELSASSDSLSKNKDQQSLHGDLPNSNDDLTVAQSKELVVNTEAQLSASCENVNDNTVTKQKKGGLAKILKRSGSIDNLLDEETNTDEEQKLSTSDENLSEANTATEKAGGLAGFFKKSPKPAPRSVATQDPLSRQLSASCDSLTDAGKEAALANSQLSASNDNLLEASSTSKEKKVVFSGITGMFRRTPKTEEQQEDEDMEAPAGGGLRRKRTIKKKRRVVSFRVKKTLPNIPKLGLASQTSDEMPCIEETLELQEMSPAQESTVEVQPVEMAAYPTEENPVEPEPEEDELLEWWNTVKGWKEWNETSDFRAEDEEMAMEQAADRVYMAARLFVRLFNQRGASLQHRILELLAMADAADEFHKKTVSAAVGGGVASVAGSVTTITGLILAPFTFGASIIVTAVGIGVATAGSITSATAKITDTVHSNMDRKKMEKMIQGYQEEIKVLRECMEFVQKGLDTLQEWDFEKYAQSAAKKAMNHNIKHVMKEGGRAGKALMINTNQLVSTVQVLGRAGGIAKAAQAISVTTGVMSALFLALDVFFLAKDSHELRKGAKTKFATKIREVCKDLQDGLLELNRVKTQLQKTMDGIEVEEFEEVEEVEVEVEDDLVSDPKKLAELEQELDLLEEKVDKKVVEVEKKGKEMEKENSKIKKVKKEEKSIKEKDEKEKKEKSLKGKDEEKEKKQEDSNDKDKEKCKSKEKMPDEEKEEKNKASGKTAKEVLKQQSQKESKQDKNTKNRITAGNDNCNGKVSKINDDIGKNKTTEKEKHKSRKEQEEVKSRSEGSKSERVKPERGSERRRSSRDDEGERKPPESTSVKTGDSSKRRHSSSSEKGVERGGEHLNRGTGEERQSRKGSEEDRGVKDWRAEMAKNREEKRQGQETENRKESHQDHEISSTKRRGSERELGGSREYSKRSHHKREHRERGDEKHGSRVESARRQFERAGGEGGDTKAKRKDDGESQRSNRERRGSERGREHEHSQPGQRARAKALLRDGLDI
uniref:Altered inheritance of mitochondria protein 21-like n=1 Tax=Haplochromis burtoni TaxID=8153 RepID=A0A3Q2VDM4_HAPBU